MRSHLRSSHGYFFYVKKFNLILASRIAETAVEFHLANGANAGQIFLTAPFAPSKKFKI